MDKLIVINDKKGLGIRPEDVSAVGVEDKGEGHFVAWFDLRNGRTYHSKPMKSERECLDLIDKVRQAM